MMQARGFTLIEVLLSVAIMGLLAGLSIPIYQSFLNRNDLSNNTEAVASSLRRAQTYARASKEDSTWGVKVQSGVITLFKGSSYASRSSGLDETVTLPGNVTASGMDELYFSKLYGVPNTTGTITLTSNNETKTVTLNAKGLVTY
jgi:prepilin-type N-terminal cleavage/methylation domain-containing protein